MRCLILVDIQNDFLPGGALAVPHGDEVIEVANRLQPHYPLVVATQDWHPADHGSFAVHHPPRKPGETIDLDGLEQILWPVHCVQNTPGSEFAAALDITRVQQVFPKGTDPKVDSYSGFFDNGRRQATGLGEYLRDAGVEEVHVVGLATDYCVKFTALDAVDLGFRTVLIEDGCRGVELQPGDVQKAVDEMRAAGVTVASSEEILRGQGPGALGWEQLAQGRFLRMVRRDGWEFVQRPPTAGVVAIVPLLGEMLLLVEQHRAPLQGPVIEFPAGLAGDGGQPHEALQLAALRELEEETGYQAGRCEELPTFATSAGLTDEQVTFFLARELRRVGPGGGVDHEDIETHQVPLAEVDRWLADQASAGAHVSVLVPAGLHLMRRRLADEQA